MTYRGYTIEPEDEQWAGPGVKYYPSSYDGEHVHHAATEQEAIEEIDELIASKYLVH